MWIARHVYDSINASRIKAEAVRDSLVLQNATLNVHMDWMRIRLTEASLERAQMLKRYLNIDVPVASFEAPSKMPDPNETISFDDVGDEVAAKLGIGWTADGLIDYTKP